VCVVDDAGHQATAFVIAHTADGFDQLVARLGRYGDPAGLPVAIERPDGRLVDRLLEAGHPVAPVQPNAIKACRGGEGRAPSTTLAMPRSSPNTCDCAPNTCGC